MGWLVGERVVLVISANETRAETQIFDADSWVKAGWANPVDCPFGRHRRLSRASMNNGLSRAQLHPR